MTGFDFENFDEKEKQITNFILQGIKDDLEGGLTSRNLMSFRNTYVFNESDSLDADYPFEMDFEVIPETIKIVSVKVSFKIKKFRAYSKAGASGGGSTPTSSSGGGQTSSSSSGTCAESFLTSDVIVHNGGYLVGGDLVPGGVAKQAHTHTVADHTHTVTIGNHAHDAVYGIFEEDTEPTIHFWISEDDGCRWLEKHGGYTQDQNNLDITSCLTGIGEKMLKFTSDVRCRISARIILKLDIKAR